MNLLNTVFFLFVCSCDVLFLDALCHTEHVYTLRSKPVLATDCRCLVAEVYGAYNDIIVRMCDFRLKEN